MKRILFIFLALALHASAAYTEFYTQTTGSNLNAGSDTNDAAELTSANGNWNATSGVFVCNGATDLSGVAVGEWASVYLDGASVAVFVGRIITVVDATDTITISLTAKSGTAPTTGTTGRTIKVGGAWKGPNGAVGFPWGFAQSTMTDASSNAPRINIKGGTTYEITAPMTHANNGPIFWEGYTTTVGDGGLAKFGGDSASPTAPYTMLTISGTGNIWRSLWFDDNGGTTSGQSVGNNAMVDITGTSNTVYRCRFSTAYRNGLRIAGGGAHLLECEAHGNNRDDAAGMGQFNVSEESMWLRCIAHSAQFGTDSSGFVISADSTEPVTFLDCIAYNLGNHGWETTGNHHAVTLSGCVAHTVGVAGFHGSGLIATTSIILLENCIFVDAGTFGVSTNNAGHRTAPRVANCAFFSNTSGEVDSDSNPSLVTGSITLTGDPFVSPSTGNFAPNNTAGAGAAVRGLGRAEWLINAVVLSAGTTGFPDLGAAQHQETGGGANEHSITQ